jgi:hypothetical protein
MQKITPRTALFCVHGDVDSDESRCPCFVPAAMKAEPWELAYGRRCRVLTSDGEDAWVFAIQYADGTIDDATVVHAHLDEGFAAADARRIGRALLNAATRLDELTSAR